MNRYEKENVDRIINEVKEMEKSGPMSVMKKAFYVYLNLGDIYQYKVSFDRFNHKNYYENIYKKIQIYQEGTGEEGEAICKDMNGTCVEALQMLGVEARLSFMNPRNPLTHVDFCFKDEEGNWYFANLTADVMRIKTGMKIRNFGLSQEQLYNKLYSEKSEENKETYLYRMNEENDGKPFVGISQEQLKQWADEFGYTYRGLYTNDVLDILAKEMSDEEFITGFFGTNKKDELAQKKFEFVMDRLGIVNVHRKRDIGDVEALQYYERIAQRIFSSEERKYFNEYKGFVEENEVRKARNIVVIKKEKENVYYLYHSESQIFEKIEKEELLKEPIQYYAPKNKLQDFSIAINNLEKGLDEEEFDIG